VSSDSKAASRKRGAAARSEAKKEPKTVDFRGLGFKLPEELPGALVFDWADVVESDDSASLVRLLRTLLGDDQVQQIRDKVTDDKVPLNDMLGVLGELVADIIGAYGMSTGESSASQDS
jgi:hypothetical protein